MDSNWGTCVLYTVNMHYRLLVMAQVALLVFLVTL